MIEPLVKEFGYLRMGSTGAVVREAQLALARLGYKLSGTGYFGGATDTAVQDFQSRMGLKPIDGVIGRDTAAALDAVTAPGLGPVIPVVAAMIGEPLWVIEAKKWLGTKEVPGTGDNPKIMRWAKEEGGAIARDYKHDSTAWCALGANMVLTKVGLKGTETLWALDFDTNKWPNFKLSGPAVGAFMPMSRAGGGHIAICIGRTRDGNLAGIGFNQGDAVSVAGFDPERPRSFRWPLGVAAPKLVGFNTLPIVNSSGITVSHAEA